MSWLQCFFHGALQQVKTRDREYFRRRRNAVKEAKHGESIAV